MQQPRGSGGETSTGAMQNPHLGEVQMWNTPPGFLLAATLT